MYENRPIKQIAAFLKNIMLKWYLKIRIKEANYGGNKNDRFDKKI